MSSTAIDPALLDLLMRYKRRVAGSYRALTPADIPTLVGPHTASRKLDGELWFLVAGSDGPTLVNPAGRTLTGPTLSPGAHRAIRGYCAWLWKMSDPPCNVWISYTSVHSSDFLPPPITRHGASTHAMA